MFSSILVIIGTIIGAGFASGQEIFTFFNVYGSWGFLGLFVAEVLIGFIVYKALVIIIDNNISTYPNFVSIVMTNCKFANSVICYVVNIFLLISFVVMCAGFSAYFSQEFGLPSVFGSFIICILSFFTFLKNINGLIKINVVFIPILIVIILILGFKNLSCFENFHLVGTIFSLKWFVKALMYASYNLIIVLPILISLKKYVSTTKQAKIVATEVTLFLLVMAIILFILLDFYYDDIKTLELPIIYIAGICGAIYKYLCGFILLVAIFTTALSSGYGFLNDFSLKSRKNYILLAFTICTIAFFLSKIGFSYLLNLLYPILGILRINTGDFYFLFS